MIAILNTSILTAYGRWEYDPCSIEQARALASGEILSAVGHESTAQVLTTLLGREVPVNRVQYQQEVGAAALIFKLRGRPPEGQILSVDEIEAIGYDFGVLRRTA